MLTAAGIILKLIFSRIAKFAAFVIEHWRVFLPAAMVCLALWYVYSLRSERDDALASLAKYKAEVIQQQQARAADNARKQQQADQQLADIMATHAEQLNQIRRQADALNITNTRNARTINDLRNRLRDAIQSGAADGLPGFPETTGDPAESGGDRDPATARPTYIEALELGCEVTTADYNALWKSWDSACQVYGCQ